MVIVCIPDDEAGCGPNRSYGPGSRRAEFASSEAGLANPANHSLDGAPGEPSRPESEVTSHSEKTYEFSRRAERPIKGMGSRDRPSITSSKGGFSVCLTRDELMGLANQESRRANPMGRS